MEQTWNDLINKRPTLQSITQYCSIPPNSIDARVNKLKDIIPPSVPLDDLRANEMILDFIGRVFMDAKKATPAAIHQGLNKYWKLFQTIYEADLIYSYKDSDILRGTEWTNKSISELRELIYTENPPREEDGATVYESIHRFPSRLPIIQQFYDHPEWEKLTHIIQIANSGEKEQWEYDAVEWLTRNYRDIEEPPMRKVFLVDSGWQKQKPFSHWVVICYNGKEISRFSFSLYMRLKNLLAKKLGPIINRKIKFDWQPVPEERQKEGKTQSLLENLFDSAERKIEGKLKGSQFSWMGANWRDGEDLAQQFVLAFGETFKEWNLIIGRDGLNNYIAHAIHRFALKYPGQFKNIMGYYKKAVIYEGLETRKDTYKEYGWSQNQEIETLNIEGIDGLGTDEKMDDGDLTPPQWDKLQFKYIDNSKASDPVSLFQDEVFASVVMETLRKHIKSPLTQRIVDTILSELESKGEVKFSEVAKILKIHKSTVSKHLKGLSTLWEEIIDSDYIASNSPIHK